MEESGAGRVCIAFRVGAGAAAAHGRGWFASLYLVLLLYCGVVFFFSEAGACDIWLLDWEL